MNQIAPTFVLPLIHDLLRMSADFVAGRVRQIGMEASDQCLAQVGMQLRFKNGEMRVLASKDPFLEDTHLEQLLQCFRNVLEMLAGFIFDAALGMAAIVAGESVAASAARQGMKQVFTFGQFAQTKIENPGTMAIDQHNSKQRRRTQEMSQ